MGYSDQSSTFVYKGLLTWQQMDAGAENDKYFKSGDPTVTGQWTYQSTAGKISLIIDTNGDDNSIEIDSEATSGNRYAIQINAGRCIYAVVDIADGYALHCLRNINEAGSEYLAEFDETHTANTSGVVKIHNDGTGNSLFIDQDGNGAALFIDSESTGTTALIYGKLVLSLTQDIAGGRCLEAIRNLNEAGTNPVALFKEDHVSGTQPVIEIHNDGSGEEIKFTNAVTRYYVVAAAEFQEADTFEYITGNAFVKASGVANKLGWHGVHLPHNAIVTAVKIYYNRTEGVVSAELIQGDNDGTVTSIVTVTGDSVAGTYVTKETTGLSAAIDNSAYQYILALRLQPIDNTLDCVFLSARISYTIAEPLP